MTRVAPLRFGDYGNGTIGVKTSLLPHDVLILADDSDITKRSFNSEWTNLCKIKMIGSIQTEWTTFQRQGFETEWIGDKNYGRFTAQSGWQQVTPAGVPHGLTFIPIWEERVYDPVNGLIWDDSLYYYSNFSILGSFSGARSYHSGPSTLPANTLWFMPFEYVAGYGEVYNQNVGPWKWVADPGPPPAMPGYPGYPVKPTYKPTSVYLVYSNSMGTVS